MPDGEASQRPMAADEPAPWLMLRPGAALDRYVINGVLGHGAMAAVFRAHDPKLGRDVALKVLAPALGARSEYTERLRREARAVAALAHPNVIRVHDFVTATEERPAYLVEELIEGITLTEFVRGEGRLLPEVAMIIVAAVADGLAAVHASGIVHRDVKPDNILVEHKGGRVRVVLTDFGVAHVAGLSTMTATGALVGSPAYMSPEQARGHDVGAGADVWALGVLLYQLTTGQLPFAGRDPLTVIAAIARGMFTRASHFEPRVGPDLEAVLTACLKQAPADRLSDAAALAKTLRDLARAGGVDDDTALLHAHVEDPKATLARLGPTVADAACARARVHVRARATARALAEIGRAQAYVPNHADARALLAAMGRNRRAVAITRLGAAMVAVIAVTALIVTRTRSRAPGPIAIHSSASAAMATTGNGPAASMARTGNGPVIGTITGANTAPTHTSAVEHDSKTTSAMAPIAAAKKEIVQNAIIAGHAGDTHRLLDSTRAAPTREARARDHGKPTSLAEASSPSSAVRTRETEPSPAATTAAPGASGISQAATSAHTTTSSPPTLSSHGEVQLSSQRGFCYPTLDERAATDLTPTYRDVPVGRHRVYCAETRDGPRVLAGEVDVPAGARLHRVVVRRAGSSDLSLAALTR